ncbi:MAG: hypothetical protein AAF513_04390 [Pseudomonadota bacterium]
MPPLAMFTSNEGSIDYGTEFDVVANFSVMKGLNGQPVSGVRFLGL